VKNKEADAFLSAGNTGAVVVAATLKLGRLKGVIRPAIATIMPTQNRPFVLIDAGANLECDPDLLHQFAVMGSVYSRNILKQASPKVGLLSIGTEDIKGNSVTKQTFSLLESSPCIDFKGNVEGHDLFQGETDVVVCDGFVGNVVLKTSESVAHAISHWLKQEFTKNIIRIIGALFLLGAKKSLKQKMDPELYGGAPLLGVNGTCIITHGASSSVAIYHAIRVACEAVNDHIDDQISENIAKITNKA
jgi:glycerol-3-phosphate acyltransferase PlsX